ERTRARVVTFGLRRDAAVGAGELGLDAEGHAAFELRAGAETASVRLANPESMAAALKTARWMAGDARLIAVLGQMAELGEIAAAEHERIGELAARLRVDRLVTIGPEAKAIAVAGVREGV